MSHTPFKEDKQTMLSILQAAHDDIEAGVINQAAFHLKNNILRDLKKHINILSVQLGTDVDNRHSIIGNSEKKQPLTRMFGKPIILKEKPKNSIQQSEDIAEIDLATEALELKNRFLVMSVEDILNTFDDVQIESVAKLVGLNNEYDDIKILVENIIGSIKNSITKTPIEIAADEAKLEAEKLYQVFVGMEPTAILDSYAETVIKFVAKSAGIPVGDNLPKKVDAKFIAQVKEAIIRKADLEEKGNV